MMRGANLFRGLAFFACTILFVCLLSGCANERRWVMPTWQAPETKQVAAEFQKLKVDPQVEKLAPEALKRAADALHDAQHPRNGKRHAKHLAFVAEKRVQMARLLTQLKKQHAEYVRLRARRNAMGGGNKTVTTLAQAVPQAQGAPTALPPHNGKLAGTAASSAGPVSSASVQQSGPAPSPPLPASEAPSAKAPVQSPPARVASASQPVPAGATAAPNKAKPAPEQSTAAEPPPVPGIQPGLLMRFASSDFDRRGHITTATRDRMFELLPKFVKVPKAKITVSGANAAHLAVVYKQLVNFGVPLWRLEKRHDGAHVTIHMQEAASLP